MVRILHINVVDWGSDVLRGLVMDWGGNVVNGSSLVMDGSSDVMRCLVVHGSGNVVSGLVMDRGVMMHGSNVLGLVMDGCSLVMNSHRGLMVGSLNTVHIGVVRDLVMGMLNIVMSGNRVLGVVSLGLLLVGRLVVSSNGNVTNNRHRHVGCFVMSNSLVMGNSLVFDWDLMANLVVSLFVMDGSGLVVRGYLVHLLSHELLEKRLRDFNVLDMSGLVNRLLVNGSCLVVYGCTLVMGGSCSVLRGAHVPDLGLGSVLRCLDVAHSRLLDIAGLRVVRLSVHWLLHVSGLSVNGL